ncbi:gas vesicle protein [Streptomyces sp. NRRL S-378]|uniref:gas vesicle protein n=1 Tax=Streptomyces sp. NRRL S-378 TaxID=1463904 RepID=UPI00055E0774|nr:gas vesicle protein [Streptomyces sp. NRRL S-378]
MSLAEFDEPLPGRQVALVDLLDRLLSGGVVVVGDIVLSIADIDLVRISLRALIVSVRSEADPGTVQDAQDAQGEPGEDAMEGDGRGR